MIIKSVRTYAGKDTIIAFFPREIGIFGRKEENLGEAFRIRLRPDISGVCTSPAYMVQAGVYVIPAWNLGLT